MKEIFPFYSFGHFINQPTNPTEFAMLRFDKMEEPNVDDYHKHTFYEILWTEKGKSKQIIDYNEYEVKPNSLFFILPNQVHYFEEWKPLTGGTILFTEDFYLLNKINKDTLFELSFLDNLYSNPYIQFSKKEFEEVLHLIYLLERDNSVKTVTHPSCSLFYIFYLPKFKDTLIMQIALLFQKNIWHSLNISSKYLKPILRKIKEQVFMGKNCTSHSII